MAELISGAALMLAAMAVLYSVWYGELRAAKSEPLPTDIRNNEHAVNLVRTARRQRALPLATIAVLDALVYAPPSISLLWTSFTLLIAREGRYDAVVATLIIIWLFTIVLAATLVQEWWRLRQRERTLKNPQSYR